MPAEQRQAQADPAQGQRRQDSGRAQPLGADPRGARHRVPAHQPAEERIGQPRAERIRDARHAGVAQHDVQRAHPEPALDGQPQPRRHPEPERQASPERERDGEDRPAAPIEQLQHQRREPDEPQEVEPEVLARREPKHDVRQEEDQRLAQGIGDRFGARPATWIPRPRPVTVKNSTGARLPTKVIAPFRPWRQALSESQLTPAWLETMQTPASARSRSSSDQWRAPGTRAGLGAGESGGGHRACTIRQLRKRP